MKRFSLGQCSVPDGERGDWRVSTFTLTEDDVRLDNLRAVMRGNAIMMCHPGIYRRLTCKGRGVVMSNTPMEVRTNMEAYIAAKGRVLINGLGLGMLLEAVLSKPEVEYVRVIEREADVIKLVGSHFTDPRLEIIHADALTYKLAKGERYDYVWHDIWDSICRDNLHEYTQLSRKYARRASKQGHWAKQLLRR